MTALGAEIFTTPQRAPDLARELQRLGDRLDALGRQVELLHRRALAAEELQNELVPVIKDVMAALSDQLGEMDGELDSQGLWHLLRKLLRSTPRLVRLLDHLESFEGLIDEVPPLCRDMVRSTVDFLERAEQRGWFRLARGGLDLLDRLAHETTQEDIDRLGDSLVLIVQTVKRMTQPGMLEVANHALGALDQERELPKVSLFRLLRALREPEVQEGLGVLLELTRAVSRRRSTTQRTKE